MSRPSEPVETTSMSSITSPSPRRMIAPLPYCFSICASAACRALAFSVLRALTGMSMGGLLGVLRLSAKAGCLYSSSASRPAHSPARTKPPPSLGGARGRAARRRPRALGGRRQLRRALVVEDRLWLVGLVGALAVERAAQAIGVEIAGPLGDDDSGDTVADQVRECACFRHEAVDAEDERQARDRHVADCRQGRSQDDEAAAGDAGGA